MSGSCEGVIMKSQQILVIGIRDELETLVGLKPTIDLPVLTSTGDTLH